MTVASEIAKDRDRWNDYEREMTEEGLKLSNISTKYVNELLEFNTKRTNVCWISAHWCLELHVGQQAANANIFQTAMI